MKFHLTIALPLLVLTAVLLPQSVSADHITFYSQLSPLCRSTVQMIGGSIRITDPALPGCNDHEKTFLSGPSAPPKVENPTTPQAEAYPGANSGWFTNWIWNPLMSWMGSWFLTISGAILRLAGLLFDNLVRLVIIDFVGTLSSLKITSAIDTGWKVFRDLSNILIIGIFTFMAIATILGSASYGYKKLLARILIIAVLINFSLLFTKLIIDFSNVTAYAVYNQMNIKQQGISQGFLDPMGINDIWKDTYTITAKFGEKNGPLAAFVYGLVGGILIFAVALVLFYGSFLIAARAVLFIFLMLTSAIAFATYLVPHFQKGEFGWDAWWKSLLNSAAFAPLLMIFLAISLVIMSAAGNIASTGNSATLGAVILDTQKAEKGGWDQILVYLLGVGLLFVSMRMASKLAGTISGFSIAAAVTALPIGFAARGAAILGRQTIGRGAARLATGAQTRSQDTKRGDTSRWLYDFTSQRLKGIAKSDMNATRTPLGSMLARASKLKSDTLTGKKVGGFDAWQTKRAERFAEKAERTTAPAKDQQEAIKTAMQEIVKSSPGLSKRQSDMSSMENSANAIVESLKRQETVLKEAHAVDLKPLIEDQARARAESETHKEDAAAQERYKVATEAVKTMQKAQGPALNEQTSKIRDATVIARRANEALTKVQEEIKEEAVRRGLIPKEIVKASDTAFKLAHGRWSNTLNRYLGITTEENDKFAKLVERKVGEKRKQKGIKDLAKAIQKEAGDDEHKGAAPRTPTAPPPASPRGPAAPPPVGGPAPH
ncbi:MAG TPA: hypothetical protein VJB97_04945 [Candidatus Paceibacterota bacterium]